MPLELESLRISHSQKQLFLKCPRAWELRYAEGLSPKNVSDKKPMLLGSAFHAGIAAGLTEMYKDGEFMLHQATTAAIRWVHDNTVPDKTRYVEGGGFERDHSYYRMMDEIKEEASKLLRFYLKRMELGTRYRVMGTHELIGTANELFDLSGEEDKACVELEFKIAIPHTDVQFSGYIDAIMMDTETNEIVIFDWKVRGMFAYDQLAGLDDQLFIYATLLSTVGVRVDKVCMFQIKSSLPDDARIGVNGLPLTGGDRGVNTTRDRWIETLPANVNPDQWLPKMEGKFKPLSEWVHPVFMPYTSDVGNLTMLNLQATIKHMQFAISNDSYPATLNQSVCKQCDFWRLCSGMQFGGDPSLIIQHSYDRKDTMNELEID
jgi:hypothetical protein